MLFEALAQDETQTQEIETRAKIAIQERSRTKFLKFVTAGSTATGTSSRLDYIAADLRKVAEDVADEYDYDNVDELVLAGWKSLGGGHASDCTCRFCKNKGKLPGTNKGDAIEGIEEDDLDNGIDDDLDADKPGQKSAKTACEACGCDSDGDCSCSEGSPCSHAGCKFKKGDKTSNWQVIAVEDGDSYTQETVSLPAADDSGLGSEGSPEIDKGKVPESGLSAIDVPSKRHPSETQDLGQENPADYAAALPGPSETGKSVDADTAMQPEFNAAPDTSTWSGTEGQANPVTSNWQVVEV